MARPARVKLTVIKRGARGAVAFDRETGSRVELAGVALDEASIADTTGAGDNFDAGFLHRVAERRPARPLHGARHALRNVEPRGAWVASRDSWLARDRSLTDMARRDTVGVGLVGSQFITTIHAEALRMVPQAEVLAVMSPTERARARFRVEAWHRAPLRGPGRDARHGRDRHGRGRRTQLRSLRDHGKGREGRQACGRREAAVPEPGGRGSHDRGVRSGRRQADVRGRAVLHAQIRPAEAAAR